MQTIRLFVEVARCRSFSKAAKAFGITQSAASQRIGQLESRLGVKLIDRSVRPFELTQAGELYLVGAIDTINRFDQMERQVSSLAASADAMEGTVRVAAIYSAGIDLLDELRAAFVADRPGVGVEVGYHKPEDVYDAVLSQQADLGIVSFPDPMKKLDIRPLRDEVMAVVCRPSHEVAGRRAIAAEELSGLKMVGFELDLPIGKRVQRYLKEHGGSPTVTHRFDNMDTLKNAVTITDQLAIVPQRCVQREVEAGTLRAVRLTPRLVRPIGLLTRRGKDGLTPAARAFMNQLIQTAGPSAGDATTPGSTQGNGQTDRPERAKRRG